MGGRCFGRVSSLGFVECSRGLVFPCGVEGSLFAGVEEFFLDRWSECEPGVGLWIVG